MNQYYIIIYWSYIIYTILDGDKGNIINNNKYNKLILIWHVTSMVSCVWDNRRPSN